MVYRASVIRILEEAYDAETSDTAISCCKILENNGFEIVEKLDVKPVMSIIKDMVYSSTRESDFVVILGGTGLLFEDVSPEALHSIIDKQATGIEIAMIHNALKNDSSLSLYRCTAGTIRNSFVLCIPGFKRSLSWFLDPVIEPVKSLIDLWKEE
ncbi:MAG: molybdopterin-binding protein [Kosmotogaceae bacterium]